MNPSETILVIVDAKARHHAGLAKAALLAERYHTRMDLLARGGDTGTAGALESLARPLRDRGLDVTTATVFADTLNAAVAQRLTGQRARFVVKDLVLTASSRRTALTHEDWELVRACPVPLLLSKPTLWSELPQICAAVDPGHDDDGLASSDEWVMEQGTLLAQHLDGQFHVLHAYIPPTFVISAAARDEGLALELSRAVLTAQYHDRLRDLQTLAAGYEVPASHVHFSIGSACEVLRGFVSQLPGSVVVMSAISRATLRRDVVGSTAEGLLRQIPCDLLVVNASQATTLLH